jgi:hypothetical protein
MKTASELTRGRQCPNISRRFKVTPAINMIARLPSVATTRLPSNKSRARPTGVFLPVTGRGQLEEFCSNHQLWQAEWNRQWSSIEIQRTKLTGSNQSFAASHSIWIENVNHNLQSKDIMPHRAGDRLAHQGMVRRRQPNRTPHPAAKHSSRLVTAPITPLPVHCDELYESSLMMHRKL